MKFIKKSYGKGKITNKILVLSSMIFSSIIAICILIIALIHNSQEEFIRYNDNGTIINIDLIYAFQLLMFWFIVLFVITYILVRVITFILKL